MYMIDERQNDDSSLDDEWASCHNVNYFILIGWFKILMSVSA